MIEDGSKILSASNDRTVKIWNPETAEMQAEINYGHEIQHIEVKDDFLVLSMDVEPAGVVPSDPVGKIIVVNMSTNSKIECLVRI